MQNAKKWVCYINFTYCLGVAASPFAYWMPLKCAASDLCLFFICCVASMCTDCEQRLIVKTGLIFLAGGARVCCSTRPWWTARGPPSWCRWASPSSTANPSTSARWWRRPSSSSSRWSVVRGKRRGPQIYPDWQPPLWAPRPPHPSFTCGRAEKTIINNNKK